MDRFKYKVYKKALWDLESTIKMLSVIRLPTMLEGHFGASLGPVGGGAHFW